MKIYSTIALEKGAPKVTLLMKTSDGDCPLSDIPDRAKGARARGLQTAANAIMKSKRRDKGDKGGKGGKGGLADRVTSKLNSE